MDNNKSENISDGVNYKTGLFIALAVIVVGRCVWSLCRRGRLQANKKTVFITGCDCGCGQRLAHRLNQLGYHVIAACWSSESEGGKQLAQLDNVDVIECDVASDKSVEKARLFVQRHLTENNQVLWGLVNNVGIAEIGLFEWMSVESFRRIHDVNVLGMVRVLLAMLPFIRESGGRVVNMGSQAGLCAAPGLSAYSMSKYAVVALSSTLRMELKSFGVKVSCICPEAYKTNVIERTHLLKIIDNHWDKCAHEIKRAYGTKNFVPSCNAVAETLANCRPNLDEVVEAMLHALNAKYPHASYDCHWTTTCAKNLLVHILPQWIMESLIVCVMATDKKS